MKIAKHISKLSSYVPGEQPTSTKVIKLNTNENPYPPSPLCDKALKSFDAAKLRLYPDPDCTKLRKAIAKICNAREECVFVGNGSDEILSLVARAFVEDNEAIGSLDPSYSLYKTIAAIRNVQWKGISSLGESLSPKKKSDAPVSLFLLTNPNAPTGEWREPSEIATFAKNFPGVVLVDEAYADFARGNTMELATAPSNRNIITMRTLSKSYSLAGLRVGYCVGPQKLIAALYKIKDSYNIDAVAQALALAAVTDQSWMQKNAQRVIATRKRFTSALIERGWDVIPSETNFVFAKPPAKNKAEDVFTALKKEGIFVRYFKGTKTKDRLRITIGTDSQMKKLINATEKLISR
jgi:histidinol-phosphate aminotransferase